MLEKYLQEIGLNEKEASVYLALLQVDSASVVSIAGKTEIKRPSVYIVLDTLAKKGLISEVKIGNKTHYAAESPDRLETYVERQKVLLDEKSKRLKDIIPEIKGIQRKEGERPIVKFFEGRDGVVSAYEEFYSSLDTKKQQAYMVYNMDLIAKTYSEEEEKKFYQIRKQKMTTPTAVYTRLAGDHKFITPGARIRIDSEKYPINTDITIVGDKIIFSSLGDHVSSFLMKSKDIAITLTSLISYINDTKKG